MGVANLLKEGIENKNWDKIILAYSELTGINLDKTEEEDEEQEGVHIIRKKNMPRGSSGKIIVTDETGETKNYGIKEPVNVNKIKAVGNLFNPSEYNDVEKDSAIGITYPKKSKKGKRPKPSLAVTACTVCRNEFRVAPFLIKSTGYVCDNCVGNLRR